MVRQGFLVVPLRRAGGGGDALGAVDLLGTLRGHVDLVEDDEGADGAACFALPDYVTDHLVAAKATDAADVGESSHKPALASDLQVERNDGQDDKGDEFHLPELLVGTGDESHGHKGGVEAVEEQRDAEEQNVKVRPELLRPEQELLAVGGWSEPVFASLAPLGEPVLVRVNAAPGREVLVHGEALSFALVDHATQAMVAVVHQELDGDEAVTNLNQLLLENEVESSDEPAAAEHEPGENPRVVLDDEHDDVKDTCKSSHARPGGYADFDDLGKRLAHAHGQVPSVVEVLLHPVLLLLGFERVHNIAVEYKLLAEGVEDPLVVESVQLLRLLRKAQAEGEGRRRDPATVFAVQHLGQSRRVLAGAVEGEPLRLGLGS
mmetsp:Transcript_6099/g.11599  ORF Transcript_6099/g.11599 Transcript_6099/m.11599 type:complete len:377 (+) Transcript_6099:1465-2595(+)